MPPESIDAIRAALRCDRPGCGCHSPRGNVHCPAHDDEKPSLSLDIKDGKLLWHCFAKCSQEDVRRALRARGLLPGRGRGRGRRGSQGPRSQVTKDYEIREQDGSLRAIHRRIEYPDGGKTCRWLAPNGEPLSENGLRPNDLPLYGINRLRPGEDVVIVEGEKAAEALWQVNIWAVGTYGTSHRPSEQRLKELLEVVGGGRIYLWPDNDEAGRKHMDRIAGELRRLGAADVRMVVWPEAPEKGDAADAVARGVNIHGLLAAAQPADRQQADIEAELEGTDAHHARVLGQELRDRACWVPSWGWLVWTGTHWERDPEEAEVVQLAMDALSTYWLRRAQEAGNPEERKRLIDRAKAASSYTVVQRALKTARADLKALPETFDADPWALAVENGVLDLRTRTLRPHSPANRNTKIARVRFDPTASCPKFVQHLARLLPNPNVRRHVQRSLGLALVGACLEERLDIWHGDGANGKSTTARVLLEVLGDYADRAAPNLLVEKRHPEHPTALADLAGKRLVFSIEVEQGQKLAEALVKDLTGGDRKKARFLFKDYFSFPQSFNLFLLVNHRPEVRGTDTAIWRRIRLVPWTVIIPPEQRRPQEEVVAELAAEGAGILNWLLDGLHDWLRDRGWEAPEVQAATQDYKLEMDQVGRFVSDCCVLRPTARVGTKALFEAYERWCQEVGETVLSRKAVGQRLRAMGINEKSSHGRRYYVGVGLLEPDLTSPDGKGRVTDGDRFPQTFESSGDNKPKIGKIGHHLSPPTTTTSDAPRLTQHQPDGTITLAEQIAPGEQTINIPAQASVRPNGVEGLRPESRPNGAATAEAAEAGAGPAPTTEGFAVLPARCPRCGGARFYQPWTGPHAGLWFCVACNPGLRPETEAPRTPPEHLRRLANDIYFQAARLGFPRVRSVGPGKESWREALTELRDAGREGALWAICYDLEECAPGPTLAGQRGGGGSADPEVQCLQGAIALLACHAFGPELPKDFWPYVKAYDLDPDSTNPDPNIDHLLRRADALRDRVEELEQRGSRLAPIYRVLLDEIRLRLDLRSRPR